MIRIVFGVWSPSYCLGYGTRQASSIYHSLESIGLTKLWLLSPVVLNTLSENARPDEGA